MDIHLVILLDCSGSMGQGFSSSMENNSNKIAQVKKIDVAKHQLKNVIFKSKFDQVTIIAFNSKVIGQITITLTEANKLNQFLESLKSEGGTSLSLALKQGVELIKFNPNQIFRLQLITDGMSQTKERDLEIINLLPQEIRTRIHGILIDKNKIGELHLKELCIDYKVAIGKEEFKNKISGQTVLIEKDAYIYSLNNNFKLQMNQMKKVLGENSYLKEIYLFLEEFNSIELEAVNQILNLPQRENGKTLKLLEKTKNRFNQAIKLMNSLESLSLKFYKYFDISLAYPLKLSKGHSSLFVVSIYESERASKVFDIIKQEFGELLHTQNIRKEKFNYQVFKSSLIKGMQIEVKLDCPEINFSEPVIIKISDGINDIKFIAKPKNESFIGKSLVKLNINETSIGDEIFSKVFSVEIVDYVIFRISRPFLSKVISVLVGLGSVLMFVLTFLEQIDTSFGLTSGAAGGLVALSFYSRYLVIFKRPKNISIDSIQIK